MVVKVMGKNELINKHGRNRVNKIIESWNARVRTDDTVYILGDFIWAKESDWPFFVGPLAGNKVLIRGNHDPR